MPAVIDGYQKSEAFWLEVIEQMENQGLSIPPLLAVADGALVFLDGSGEEMARDGNAATLGTQDGTC
uniref:hypothetical protein n=1 Tax=Candidatus Vondammii sp. HM_W22 TaxID=2687299 RepID=UPI001F141361|nr:hypothetical protein [Candidatus Vondammii sp. HM_W22]